MPHTLTPLRYPGGKSQFYEQIKKIIRDNHINNFKYIEPFAGGAGIAIKLLLDGICDEIIINDVDTVIYSFWYTVINEAEWLIDKIASTDISIDEWYKQKYIYDNNKNFSIRDIGFSVLFLNRCNRSGILAAGPIGGKNQTGKYKLDCRFNKIGLMNKIRRIAEYSSKIRIYNLDATDLIFKFKNNSDTFWFIDPPYFKKGNELYKNSFDYNKHNELSKAIKRYLINQRWLLTYDYCDDVLKLYDGVSHKAITLNYSVGTKRKETEHLFYNNLCV